MLKKSIGDNESDYSIVHGKVLEIMQHQSGLH